MATENAISEFLSTYRQADMIEAVIDTSVSHFPNTTSQSMIPYLNLYALNIFEGKNVGQALQQVADTDNWGFLADVTEEIGISDFEIPLTELYPRWPDDLDEGDRKVINILTAAKDSLSLKAMFLFHHVDVWPPFDVQTGIILDIS